ncbi:MAG: GNAT family N-acetyltransferase [Deltaproteobacteria bacterium]|jgi:GNAT superfamily N-acetyltransferase|nr:MAG: GNAT family N-acetyltransferase [Deltaproteobacteria bacterium]TMB25194.1 MAG: GNAT family N-acetyltransferase [Deltaproteobacteria bacterium]
MRRARCEAFWRLLHLLGGPGGRVSTIRSCRSADFGAVFELLRQHWPEEMFREPALRGVFERGLASPRQRYVCAEFDSRVVGFGSLTVKSSLRHEGAIGHVDELVVDHNHRCRGIATLLMQRIEELAVAIGCRQLQLDCAFHRKEAHTFYRERRFERRALLFAKALREI